MLIYHPAYDAYHAVFRALLLADTMKSLELDKLRIIDFYVVFPAELANVRLPRELTGFKKKAAQLINPYHGPVNALQAFRDIQPIQLAAVRALAGSGLIDSEATDVGRIIRTEKEIPENLSGLFASSLSRLGELREFLFGKFADIPLRGADGLKHRTGLLEYQYDVS